ncbi:hypothetical protein ACQ3I4_12505 [Zafaria sp. Z1313]|uniref:hypothetical protein n=1 Tax=unclassified Zafaria TaxID=2828765 RepID=UPI002E78A58E|nr:hypothetical protein [Zafaria sp. J156]MEE1620502.1 hypothetical protein [Zafaria sp. J156]
MGSAVGGVLGSAVADGTTVGVGLALGVTVGDGAAVGRGAVADDERLVVGALVEA